MEFIKLNFLALKLSDYYHKFKEEDGGNWRKNLVIICISQFIAMIGMSSVVPFLPLFIRELGIPNTNEANLWSGLVLAGPYFLAFIAVPFWGALGDRYSRKLMMMRAIIGLAFAVTLMGFVSNVAELLALRIFQGAVSGFIASALSFVSANTPINKSGFAISLLQSSQMGGNIIGPLFGGFVADTIGIRPVFFIVGALCLISGIIIYKFVIEINPPEKSNAKQSLTENLKFAVSHKNALIILLFIFLAQGGMFFTTPIFPYFVETLNAPKHYLASITGILVALVGIVSIIFSPYWGRHSDRKDYRTTLFIATLTIGLIIFAHTIITNYLWLFPMRIVIGIFFAGVIPTLQSALNKITPTNIKGGVMSLSSSSMFLGSLISFVLCGIIASRFGIIACFYVSSAAVLLIPILLSLEIFTKQT